MLLMTHLLHLNYSHPFWNGSRLRGQIFKKISQPSPTEPKGIILKLMLFSSDYHTRQSYSMPRLFYNNDHNPFDLMEILITSAVPQETWLLSPLCLSWREGREKEINSFNRQVKYTFEYIFNKFKGESRNLSYFLHLKCPLTNLT